MVDTMANTAEYLLLQVVIFIRAGPALKLPESI